jgi:hypothetical protein
MAWKNRAMILFASGLLLIALSTGNVLGAVDPDRIVFNEMGDPITGNVELDLKNNNITTIAYNVYDADNDPIGTKTSWSCTGQDVVNITEMNAGQTFRVIALKVGTAVLTVRSQGDTKNLTKSLNITVKAPAPVPPTKFTNSTNTTAAKKGFIPGYEALPALAATGLVLVAAFRKRRR